MTRERTVSRGKPAEDQREVDWRVPRKTVWQGQNGHMQGKIIIIKKLKTQYR
jgi:hypothetical protein